MRSWPKSPERESASEGGQLKVDTHSTLPDGKVRSKQAGGFQVARLPVFVVVAVRA